MVHYLWIQIFKAAIHDPKYKQISWYLLRKSTISPVEKRFPSFCAHDADDALLYLTECWMGMTRDVEDVQQRLWRLLWAIDPRNFSDNERLFSLLLLEHRTEVIGYVINLRSKERAEHKNCIWLSEFNLGNSAYEPLWQHDWLLIFDQWLDIIETMATLRLHRLLDQGLVTLLLPAPF